METVFPTDRHEQTPPPYFLGLLDEMRSNKNHVEEIVESITYVDGDRDAIRKKLEFGFYAAIMAQRDAVLSEDEETQLIAKGVSILAYSEGCKNEYLPVGEYPKQMRRGRHVSGEELKVLQVKKMLATLRAIINNPDENEEDKIEAALRIEALKRYTEVTPLIDVIQIEPGDDGEKNGNILTRNGDKIASVFKRSVAAMGLSALALIGTTNTSHAAEKSPVDDESHDPHDTAYQGRPRFAKPIRLATPGDEDIKPPVVVTPAPESSVNPDGSVQLATLADNEIKPPVRVEASPDPNIIPIPNAPVKPPQPPAPAIEKAPKPLPKGVNIDILAAQELSKIKTSELSPAIRDTLHANTNWNNAGKMLEYLMVNGDLTESQAIGVVANAMWESAGVNPGQSQIGGPAFGIVQWEGGRRTALEAYAAAQNKPAADLYMQLDFMILELKRDAWNGYADLKQAKNSADATLIFMRKFERPGIPHEAGRLAMNKIITDLYNEKWYALEKIQKDATAAGAKEGVTKISQPVPQEVEPFDGWGKPVPEGSPMTSDFGPRGAGGHHDGEDFGVETGTPFLAVTGGKVKVVVVDVRNDGYCASVLNNIGYPLSVIKDPIQKDVHVTRMIGDDEYTTIYSHLSEILVEPGQIVKKGQQIGKTGGSGCSTGDHAHFEIRKNGVPIDPSTVLG